MKLVLLGPPGAGKGTLANLLKSSLNILHISTGDILREEIKNNTTLGQEAKKYIDNGKLVPDELVTRLIKNKFAKDDRISKGYMLDGYPRTEQQAQDLDKILKEEKKLLNYAIYLDSTLPVIIQRLGGRRICRKCGAVFHIKNRPPKKEGVCDLCQGELYQRPDDNKTTIETRMKEYLTNTKPIIEYYKKQGILVTVDSDEESEDVQTILMKTFNENGKSHNH